MTKPSQHTPGPWSQKGRDIFSGTTYIADVKANRLVPPEEAEANARLIAAAPELLEALRDLVSPYDGNMDGAPTSIKLARAAIAKAGGCAMKTILKNDVITYHPQWMDRGDDKITFRAMADYDGSGSIDVVACLGLPFNPWMPVKLSMIATVNGEPLVMEGEGV